MDQLFWWFILRAYSLGPWVSAPQRAVGPRNGRGPPVSLFLVSHGGKTMLRRCPYPLGKGAVGGKPALAAPRHVCRVPKSGSTRPGFLDLLCQPAASSSHSG